VAFFNLNLPSIFSPASYDAFGSCQSPIDTLKAGKAACPALGWLDGKDEFSAALTLKNNPAKVKTAKDKTIIAFFIFLFFINVIPALKGGEFTPMS